MIQRGIRERSTTNCSGVMASFLGAIEMFSGQNKYANIRRF